MSDKHTHESDETPTERLLREALAARAERVTAQDLRPAAPPSRRLRRLRPVLAVTVPLLALAASVLGYATLGGTPVAVQQTQAPAASLTATPDAAPTSAAPSSSPSDSVSASESPSASAATPYTFDGVSLQVPAGWTPVKIDNSLLCLMAPGKAEATRNVAGCAPYGVTMAVWDTAPGAQEGAWPTQRDVDSSSGWSHQAYCPVWDNPHDIADGSGYGLVGTPQRSVVEIGGHYASTVRWQVTCGGSEQFTAQGWGFGKDQVTLIAAGLKSDYQDDLQSLVNSIDLSGHTDPLHLGHAADIHAVVGEPSSSTSNGIETVTFSVTWQNLSKTPYAHIEPVVAADRDPLESGTQTVPVENRIPTGTLERKDGSSWTQLPALRMGSGMDYATTGRAAAFALDPGASHTVTYRMKLTTKDQTSGLGMVFQGFLSTAGGTFTKVEDLHDGVPIHQSGH